MPLNSLFSVEGSTAVQAHAVAYGATVDLAIQDLTGVEGIAWSIVSTSYPDQTAPTISLAGVPSGATASFAQIANPGDGLGRAYLVKLRLTGGGLTSETYRVVGTANAAGRVPVCPGEENHRHATNGWAHPINQALNAFVGTAGAVFTWGAATATTAEFLIPGTRANATSTASGDATNFFVTRSGTFRNMVAYSSGSMTVTLRVNNIDTTLTCSPNNSVATDIVNTVAVVFGDVISMRVTGAAGAQILVAASLD